MTELDGKYPLYVWENTLDNKYHVFVERINIHKGALVVEEDGKRLMEKEIPLSYGAAFGPDMFDIQDWEQLCIEFVDAR